MAWLAGCEVAEWWFWLPGCEVGIAGEELRKEGRGTGERLQVRRV
jgi:hypothetical protein